MEKMIMPLIKYFLYLMFGVFIILMLLINVIGIISPLITEDILFTVFGVNKTLRVDFGLNERIIHSLFSLSVWAIAYGFGMFNRNVVRNIIIVALAYFGAYYLADKSIYVKYGLIVFAVCVLIVRLIIAKMGKKKTAHKFAKKVTNNSDALIFSTEKGNILLENPSRGIYIQGGAGSGKSDSIIKPIISQVAEKGYTGLLYDWKSPELTNIARASYLGKGVAFKNVDFKNPYQSDKCNPISPQYITKSGVAIEFGQTLINNLMPSSIKNDDFWTMNARMILSGVIWYLREEHPKYCTIPHVVTLLLHNDIKLVIEKVSENYEAGGMVASLKQSIERDAHNQVSGVVSTIQTVLSRLNTKDIFWVLSKDDINLDLNNPLNPTLLALGNDSTLPNTYSPLIALIAVSCLRQMNQEGKKESVVLLDEAPTIYIPNIEQIPATGRSNKIATVFGVQDYSQLVDKYGKEKAEVIISNLGNQFYGRTTNEATAEKIVKIFSKEDKTYETTSQGTGTSGKVIHFGSSTNKGRNESIQERSRVKVIDLIHLDKGQFYGIIAEGKPKEFLNTQFKRVSLSNEINLSLSSTDEDMKTNYNNIVNEAKSLLQ